MNFYEVLLFKTVKSGTKTRTRTLKLNILILSKAKHSKLLNENYLLIIAYNFMFIDCIIKNNHTNSDINND